MKNLIFKSRLILNKFWNNLKLVFVKQEVVDDPSYFDAVEFIKGKPFITYNQLQRGLNIGYARTSRILELLEENHKIGKGIDGREKRKVLI